MVCGDRAAGGFTLFCHEAYRFTIFKLHVRCHSYLKRTLVMQYRLPNSLLLSKCRAERFLVFLRSCRCLVLFLLYCVESAFRFCRVVVQRAVVTPANFHNRSESWLPCRHSALGFRRSLSHTLRPLNTFIHHFRDRRTLTCDICLTYGIRK